MVEFPSFYYCSPIRLRVGSIIEPGNWGRIIRSLYQVGIADHDFRLHREMAYEFGRQVINPRHPSRLDCFFACPTKESAEQYRQINGPTNEILKIEAVEKETTIFTTSWALFGSPTGTNAYGVQSQIINYWSGNATDRLEVLIGGPVRVVD